MEAVPWDLLPIIGPTGFSLVLVLTLTVGLYKAIQSGAIVTRREHKELRDDRDWWRDAAVRALDIGERVVHAEEQD